MNKEHRMKEIEFIVQEQEKLLIDIQNQIYFGYDKPVHFGSINIKMINLHNLLRKYSAISIDKYLLEEEYVKLENKSS